MDYQKERFDLVNNPAYVYYKLYVDGKCQFDEFYDEVIRDVKKSKDMAAIINLTDNLGAMMLPSTKFNHIQDSQRCDK